MTTTEHTALVVRDYTPKQLRQRIELAQRSFGLREANPTQLNALYFLCEKWKLDPLTDITLFEGQPFVTIEGRLRLLRRHPEYRGFDCRPLSKEEKNNWGYEPDDIVIECAVRTTTWGDVKARGKVSGAEVAQARERAERSGKRPAPIGVHPVEIAEKRAIARAERAAFGQETVLDDEEVEAEVQTVIQERNDPERVRRNAEIYDRTIGAADWGETPPTRDFTSSVVQDDTPADAPHAAAGALVTSKTDPLWKRFVQAERTARAAGVEEELLALADGVKLGQISETSLEGACLQLESAAAERQAVGQGAF